MNVIPLNVPYLEKDEAKSLGAKWDFVNKCWYITDELDQNLFQKWLPADYYADSTEVSNTEISPSAFPEKGLNLIQYLAKISQTVKKAACHAEWIRVEISKIDIIAGGHCFLELVDTDKSGNQIAKCKANIWQDKKELLFNYFQQQTGSAMQAGMKILLFGRADFHVLYGLSIIIEDIDPSYTIGDAYAKLKAIREKLQAEKIYAQNKTLLPPKEFTNIAVLSPQQAAGLGDFRKEADLLTEYGLCTFTYYEATFQGKNAGAELQTQIKQIMRDHDVKQYDALVIIRGGGAVTDLAWLNDYAIAREICFAPLPIFSGIGHEKDNTIIDEVACFRFDTPSKVIKHIWSLITENATRAQNDLAHIFERATYVLNKNQQMLLTTLQNCFREATFKVKEQKIQLQQNMHNIIYIASSETNRISERVGQLYQLQIMASLKRLLKTYEQKVTTVTLTILERSQQNQKNLYTKLVHLMQIVFLASPEKILSRGFTLIRAKDNQLITTKKAALRSFAENQELKLIFFDGDLIITGLIDR